MKQARGIACGLVLVGIATSIGWFGSAFFDDVDVVMLYLLAVVITAAAFTRLASVTAAAASVFAYDFFFVAPVLDFAVGETRHWLSFLVLFGVGVTISTLAQRIRRQEQEARVEELRSALLSTVSHDLRTPLAVITGAATTLRDSNTMSEADRRELLASVCDEATRMERLITSLLDMTRLEAGVSVKRDWVPLEDLIGAAISRIEPQLANRDVRVRIAADVPMVAVDAVLYPQVFVNLLENAVKYAPASSAVEIEATLEDRRVAVTVADSGPGFGAADHGKLFEKFVRGNGGDRSGVGLGLAIVRGIVTAHGGEVGASNRPGGGALIRFTIPLVGEPPTIESTA